MWASPEFGGVKSLSIYSLVKTLRESDYQYRTHTSVYGLSRPWCSQKGQRHLQVLLFLESSRADSNPKGPCTQVYLRGRLP